MIDFFAAPLPRMPEGLSIDRQRWVVGAEPPGGAKRRKPLVSPEPYSWVSLGDLAAALVAALALSQSPASGAGVSVSRPWPSGMDTL